MNSKDNKDLWQSVLAQVQFAVSRANFATWFRNTEIISNQNGKVLISVPNSFSKEWLSNKYHSLILKILRSLDKNIRMIEFVVKSEAPQLIKRKRAPQKKEIINNSQLQFVEFKIDQKTNLNPRYTFENFVVGGFNELAHAAAWAISENPGTTYNPLFIYGGVGLGKTHLLQATGNRIVNLFPNKRVKYTPSETFISGIVESIRNHKIEEFKKELRKIDILIMDDVQFFAGKEKTQEEFFHIFNSFYQAQKQIILSSDRPPNAIPALEERLKSRFEGGMIADIGVPDFETRVAILKAKCEERNINLNQDILEYIATNIQRNIREMEGALNRLAIYQKINQKEPDFEVAKKLLRNLVLSPKKSTSFKQILRIVSAFYDLSEKDLLLPTRRKEIVKPRQIAMYLLREELKESYPAIGRRFQGKDHTTAIYAYEKIAKQLEEDDNLLTEITLIKQRLYNNNSS